MANRISIAHFGITTNTPKLHSSSIKIMAVLLGVSQSSLKRWLRGGYAPAEITQPGPMKFNLSEIEALMPHMDHSPYGKRSC